MNEAADQFMVKFWGTRGSMPTPGHETLRYGGNTSCVEVRCNSEIIIFDAGTGIAKLGQKLQKEEPIQASLFFSHVHWDHIQGMPFFLPAYHPGNKLKLYGNKNWSTKLEYALRWQMQSPTFPVTFDEMNKTGAKMEYIDIQRGEVFRIGADKSIIVRSGELNHPDKAFGFRVEYNGKTLVYATDVENLPHVKKDFLELAAGADFLIHDAQYTHIEYFGLNGSSPRRNWGHSTPEAAAEAAKLAGVKNLILFHHEPTHNDDKIDEMLKTAMEIFPDTVAAYEGMEINL
ncbi:MBL fold metallo-hydrolase [Candidatus Poribacteria bacterium]|nr:MBL fold metallo-hydrolase [Candidatus Poribacteria bacterium]